MPHSTATTTTAHKPPFTPDLPMELWMHILALASADTEALPRLWFAARATSRLFRTAAEAAFPAAHLRRWLHVCSFKIPRAALAFERLADDGDDDNDGKERAVLRAMPWRGFDQERDRPATTAEKMRRIAEAKEAALGPGVGREWIEVLRSAEERGFGDHMVCLRGVVQDTELTGWRVVSGGQEEEGGVFEVEVEWKGMLDRMFGDELKARRRGDVLAKRFKKHREDTWSYFGPEVINKHLSFNTFEAVLLANEDHRAYPNGYRDVRRLRIEEWIERTAKGPEHAYALRKKEIDAEWVPNFRMNAVRERLEMKLALCGEERAPQASVIRRRLLESDVPMKRELCTLEEELKVEEEEWNQGDEVEQEEHVELGLLWKGKTPEQVAKIMSVHAFTATL